MRRRHGGWYRGLALCGAAALVAALGADCKCSGGSPDGGGEAPTRRFAAPFLEHIPADTPFVVAAAEPLPQAVVEAYLRLFRPTLRTVLANARTNLGVAPGKPGAPALPGPPTRRFILAAFEELDTVTTVGDLTRLGIGPAPTGAVFGLGLVPAMRVRLADPAAFLATLARVEQRAGITLRREKVGEREVFSHVEHGVRAVLAIVGNDLVGGLLPEQGSDSLLPALFGDRAPAKSLADSRGLEQLSAQYGFPGHALGYVDSTAVVRALGDDQMGAKAALFGLLGQAPPDVSGVCRKELEGLAAQLPRVVFGYDEASADRLGVTWALEMAPELRAALVAVQGAAPGPGAPLADADLLQVRVAVDVGRLLAFVRERTAAVATKPYQCPRLADLNAFAGGVSGRISGLVLPPVVTQLRGLHLHVQRVTLQAGLPTEVAGTVAVRTLQPTVLLALAQGFVPELALLRVEPNGKLVPLPPLPRLPMVQDAQVAVQGEVLAASVGADQAAHVPGLLGQRGAEAQERAPLLSVGYDAARFLELTNTYTAGLASHVGPQAQAQLQQGAAVNEQLQAIFGMTEYSLRLTERGLSLRQTLSLRPQGATAP